MNIETDLNQPYTVEWHPESEHLHTQPLSEALRQAQDAYFVCKPPGWVIIAIGNSYADASRLMEQLERNKT